MLSPATGYYLEVSKAEKGKNCIILQISSRLEHFGDEGYKMKITPEQVRIEAANNKGIFYGITTIRQLLPVEIFRESKVNDIEWVMPCVEIEDYPRFEWRGMHLDAGRHFMPREFVKKHIDFIVRLQTHLKRLDILDVNYHPLDPQTAAVR